MMEIEKIKSIIKIYQEGKSHEEVMAIFGLNLAQEYAINVFGRDNHLSPEILAPKIDDIKDELTIGEVAVALGFPAEMSLKRRGV